MAFTIVEGFAMRSAVNIKGHPTHPLLIAFPVAFVTGAPLADIFGRIGGWHSFWATGGYMSVAAVVTGIVAAIPGLIDYFLMIPPDSSAKQRATWHLMTNSAGMICFAVSWLFRDWHSLEPHTWAIVLELVGFGFVGFGGWLGGTLVYRNQIAIDHRYADAGKWNEQTVYAAHGERIVIARSDELKPGQMKLLHLNNRRIVLARTDEGYCAFDDHCTHRGGPLSDGVLACKTVTCPWHGSQFDVTNGDVKAGPADDKINTWTVEESGGEVRLKVIGV
jgi:nitrite reductase/ring-hydroxylating ferredoxin subunit/uncharacterized membrane protein